MLTTPLSSTGQIRTDRGGLSLEEQKKQTVFDAPKIIAIGIASPAATLLTSRFGIAGTLLGLALGAMILTAVADFLKVYLARTSHAAHTAATKVPEALKAPRGFLPGQPFRRKGRSRQKAPYQGFSSPPGGRWRRWSLFVGKSVVAAGISFLLGVGAVTAIEHSAGKSLSCLVWEECPVQASAEEDDGSSDTSTQPSIFGGGPSAPSGAAANVQPTSLQQRPAPAPGTPETPLSQTRSKSAGSVGSASGTGEGWQNRSEQQQDSSYYSEEYEQQSSSSSSTEEGQDGGSAGWEKQTTTSGEYEFPSVPWST